MSKTFQFSSEKELKLLLNSRFKLIHLPVDIKNAVISDITKWYSCNGSEWTNDRLKFINQCTVNYVTRNAQLPVVEPGKKNSSWLKTRDKYLFSGHWGALQRYAKKSNKSFKEVLKLLQCYSVFSYQSTTTEMIDEFIEEIEAASTANPQYISQLLDKLQVTKEILLEYIPDELLQTDIEKVENLAVAKYFKAHHEQVLIKQASEVATTVEGKELIEKYPILQQVMYEAIGNQLLFTPPSHTRLVQGCINVLLEPGMKKRFVLDFYKPFELAIYPLGERIYDILRYLPWDSTFDEARGYNVIQRQLRLNKTCYCFDLSSATDRFPYELQFEVLKSLNLGKRFNEQLSLLNELVKLPARLPDGRNARWVVGQPMGAFPSFAMFSLTHGMVLLALNDWQYNDDFIVHGDDVVIMSKKLAQKYKEFLRLSGCKCNMFKSIISNKYAEMNSKIITRDTIIQKSKWKPFRKQNILDHVKYWGSDILKFVYKNPDDLKKAELVTQLPGIFSDGTSMNPKGLSIEERIAHFEHFYSKTKDLSCNNYSTDYRTRVYERFSYNKRYNDEIRTSYEYYDLYKEYKSTTCKRTRNKLREEIPNNVLKIYSKLGPDLVRELCLCNPSDLSRNELQDLLGSLEVATRTEQELVDTYKGFSPLPDDFLAVCLGSLASKYENFLASQLRLNETVRLFSLDIAKVVKSYQQEGRIQEILEFYA